jgi:hypothetical protein
MEAWRQHPELRGRFLPDHPDDLQVLVHDGGPRVSQGRAPELVWVRVTAAGPAPDVFTGICLNQPSGLRTITQGASLLFRVPGRAPHPYRVDEKYLREIADWRLHPCSRCGFDGLFDAPSDLAKATFPDAPPDAEIEMFTTFCPWCGGVVGLERLRGASADPEPPPVAPKPWWKFWA